MLLGIVFIVHFDISKTFAQTALSTPNTSSKKASGVNKITTADLGYFDKNLPDALLLLPSYPAEGTIEDKNDLSSFNNLQATENTTRWKLALEDDHLSYDRFSATLGFELNAAKTPFIVHVWNRSERDVLNATFNAKKYFNRPRPFQRFAVEHVCGEQKAPLPQPNPQGGSSASSYPSGHASFGWGLALVLAEIAPDKARLLLARAREYGDNRVVCAVHYPSDVEGGKLVATWVVGQLHASKVFMHDLECAKQEYRLTIGQNVRMSTECLVPHEAAIN
jgi:acid phosphatase (class A)